MSILLLRVDHPFIRCSCATKLPYIPNREVLIYIVIFHSSGQALRLYNHFNWLPQLRERSGQLHTVVGRERRLSLSLVRKEVPAQAAQRFPRDGTTDSAGGAKTGGAQHESTGETAGGKEAPTACAKSDGVMCTFAW